MSRFFRVRGNKYRCVYIHRIKGTNKLPGGFSRRWDALYVRAGSYLDAVWPGPVDDLRLFLLDDPDLRKRAGWLWALLAPPTFQIGQLRNIIKAQYSTTARAYRMRERIRRYTPILREGNIDSVYTIPICQTDDMTDYVRLWDALRNKELWPNMWDNRFNCPVMINSDWRDKCWALFRCFGQSVHLCRHCENETRLIIAHPIFAKETLLDSLHQTTISYFEASVSSILRYLSDTYEDFEDLWNALTPRGVNAVYYELRRRGVV